MSPPGSRPLKKILLGDDAQRYLPVGTKKLADLHRNPAPVLSTTVIVDDATIMVEKMVTLDRITIDAGGIAWKALAVSDLYNVKTQIAYAGRANGAWKEPPRAINDTTPTNDNIGAFGATSLLRKQNFSGGGPFYVLGDGRWAFALDSGVQEQHLFILNSKNKFLGNYYISYNGLIAGRGRAPGFDAEGRPVQIEVAEAYDNMAWGLQPIRAPNRNRDGEITLQFAVSAPKGLNLFVDGHPVYRECWFYLFDVANQANPPFGEVPGVGGYFTASALQKTYVGKSNTFANPSTNFDIRPFVFLTPQTIIIGGAGIQTGDFITGYETAVSTDGGQTFGTRFFDPEGVENQGAGGTDYYMVALNAFTALRSAGASAGGFNDEGFLRWWMSWVHIVAGVTHKQEITDTEDGLIGNIEASQLIAMGRGVYVCRLNIFYLFPPEMPGGPRRRTRRVKFIHSLDYGATWSMPVDSGFDPTDVTEYRRGTTSFTGPRDSPGRIYSRDPYLNAANRGKIYMPVGHSDVTPSFTATPLGSTLYVSTDLGDTWTPAVKMSSKPQFELPSSKGPILFNYLQVCDTETPIDPIFPWRVDATISPPDWWLEDTLL